MFIGIVLLKCWVWMKEFSSFDLRFGFYVNNYKYGQSSRSQLAHPGQNVRKFIKNIGFWLSPEVLEGLVSSERVAGTVSTHPGTSPTLRSRVMAKNPGRMILNRLQNKGPVCWALVRHPYTRGSINSLFSDFFKEFWRRILGGVRDYIGEVSKGNLNGNQRKKDN